MSCINGILLIHRPLNFYNLILSQQIMIGFPLLKDQVMYLQLDSLMEALEFIIKLGKLKKQYQMLILNQSLI
jgi:hypothetical protein